MKAEEPFKARVERGILRLTLETPRAAVNILDRPSAEQLVRVLSELPTGLRAIVFESGKAGSFINGVGLMMASAVRSLEAAKRIAGPIVRAYELVERAPVPTIAAIRGNCFGCGVEFVLRCTHRIAADTADTQFYMTELAEYLFAPAFGAMKRLPRVLGLDRAADFLLWGERWWAQDALRAGLVDRVVGESFEEELERVLRRPPRRKRVEGGELADHLERIEALPPSYQPLYRSCLRMMARGTDGDRELALSAKTAADPISKQALGFFFVRQIAADLGRRGRTARIRSDARSVQAIAREHGVEVRRAMGGKVPAKAIVYHPDRVRRRALVEIAGVKSEGASLVMHLERAGFVPFVSGSGELAIDALLRAHFRPMFRALERGVEVRAINQTLRKLGFVERPHVLLERFPMARLFAGAERRLLAMLQERTFGGRSDAKLLDELCLSWLACVRELLSGTIAHPTIVDVVARELLDFPLAHRSLCSYLTRDRVKAALVRATDERGIEAAEAHLAKGRDFYA